MGIFTKFKDIFTLEEEEEIDTGKKEETKVVKEEVEAPVVKKERSNRPIFFSEEDFNDDTIVDKPVAKKTNPIPLSRAYRQTEVTQKEKEKEEVKQVEFKPRQIISPIYGIINTTPSNNRVVEKEPVKTRINDLDKARKLAYSSLIKETVKVETPMGSGSINHEEIIFDEIMDNEEVLIGNNETDVVIDSFEKIEHTGEFNLSQYNEDQSTLSEVSDFKAVREATKALGDTAEFNINGIELGSNDTVEYDFYNLIDSMYKKGDE